MISKPTPAPTNRPANAPGGQRSSPVLPAVLVGVLVIGAAIAYKKFQSQPPPSPVGAIPAAPEAAQTRPGTQAAAPLPDNNAMTATTPTTATTAEVTSPAAAPARDVQRPPDVDSHELMVSLASLDTNGPISADDAQKWKASLQQLIRQGASSIPAIQEYLAQNLDVNYSAMPGGDQLGYSSMRASLLDALGQIGGPQGTAAMLQIMQTSVYPTDVATLAATLAQQAPGQYDGQVLSAVRNQLSLAAQDQLGNANVGPLFQLLATAGANGTDVTADLSQYSANWPYYASIELASLPNGAGVASLTQIAQANSGVNQSAAVQALAQLAPQNSQALTSLLGLVQQGQVSDAVLADMAPYLTGRENELGPTTNPPGTTSQGLHLANGNQDFALADTGSSLTPDQVTQRISVIDQLLQDLPAGDTMAQAALQGQKNTLTGRQGK